MDQDLESRIAAKFGVEDDAPESSGGADDAPLQSDDDAREPLNSLSDAAARYQNMQDEREQQAQQPEQAEQPEPRAESPKKDLPENDEAVWSASEVEAISRCENERLLLQRDIDAFNHYAGRVGEIADPTRRAEYEYQLGMYRQELDGRIAALNRATDGLRQSWEARQTQRAQHLRSKEFERLTKAFPDFDTAKARSYAAAQGYTEQELENARDARDLIVLEKARRYDEMQKQVKPRTVKKVTKQAPLDHTPRIERDTLEAAQTRMKKFHRPGDVERVLELKGTFNERKVRVRGEGLGELVSDYYKKHHKTIGG